MTIYYTVLFIHVVSVIGLFIALAAEGAILFRIRTAQSVDETRFFVGAFQRLRIVAIPSFLGILVGGLYLASKWGRGTFWIPFALGATLLIMLIGGLVTGKRITRGTGPGNRIPDDCETRLARLAGRSSCRMRCGVARCCVDAPSFQSNRNSPLSMESN